MTDKHFPYREADYSAEIVEETLSDGQVVYLASYPELEGAMAHGETEQEARENLSEAFEMAVEHLLEFNLPIPEPRHQAVQQVVVQSYLLTTQASTHITVTSGTQSLSQTQVSGAFSAEWLRHNLYFNANVPTLTIDQNGKSIALAEAS